MADPSVSTFIEGEGEEYLYLFRSSAAIGSYDIFRWNLNANHGGATVIKTPLLRVPPMVPGYDPIFASVGSRIYMIAGHDVMEVETKKLQTNDMLRRSPGALVYAMKLRFAVPIQAKIYIFPDGEAPAEGSGLEVFDPDTGTSKPLPGLPRPSNGYRTTYLSYLLVKTKLVFLVQTAAAGPYLLYTLDTSHLRWEHITFDYAIYSLPLHNALGWKGQWVWESEFESEWEMDCNSFCPDPSTTYILEHTNTIIKSVPPGARGLELEKFIESRPTFASKVQKVLPYPFHRIVPLDDGITFFAIIDSPDPKSQMAVVRFGDDPVRVVQWYRVIGIPEDLLDMTPFSYRGDVFFAYPDDGPNTRFSPWDFKRFSLAPCTDPRTGEHFYVATPVSSFQDRLPCVFCDSFAPFIIKA